jgi:hypothetical protein
MMPVQRELFAVGRHLRWSVLLLALLVRRPEPVSDPQHLVLPLRRGRLLRTDANAGRC